MPIRGLICLSIVYSYQILVLIGTTILVAIVIGGERGEEIFAGTANHNVTDASSIAWFISLIIIGPIPNFIFFFKVNKWTTRYWLDRGYKPVGPGWDKWGSKVGLAAQNIAASGPPPILLNIAAPGPPPIPLKSAYLQLQQQAKGPFTPDQIRALISVGTVNGDTPCCIEGSSEWKTVQHHFPTMLSST